MTQKGSADLDFVLALQRAVERYLRAVDAWELAFSKYYRLAGPALEVSSDMETEQREFEASARALEQIAPRARLLTQRHGLRDPWSGLLKVRLGQHAPQAGRYSAISRNERSAIQECLIDLVSACQHPRTNPGAASAPPERGSRSWLGRIVDFFY